MASKKEKAVADFLKSIEQPSRIEELPRGGTEPSEAHALVSEGSTPSPATKPESVEERIVEQIPDEIMEKVKAPEPLNPNPFPALPIGLESAFNIIREHIAAKGRFTHAQMDLGIEMSLGVFASSDQALFREIAQQNGIPLWQALWGQYRRCDEMGLAFTPILDPGWSPTEGAMSLGPRKCPECGTEFQPRDWGQTFDSDRCGTEAERRIRDARLAEERAAYEAEMEKRKKAEPDVKATDFSRLPESEPLIDEVPAEVLDA